MEVRELAAHGCVRGGGSDSRRLPGLPLGAKYAFQSIPSRRGAEGLSGRHDCEGSGQAPRGEAAESLPDTQRPRRHFSGDERAACQGDAVYVSRVLAEDAAQLRSLEGSENQAAQNQTVPGPAAQGACLSHDLTSSPTYSESRVAVTIGSYRAALALGVRAHQDTRTRKLLFAARLGRRSGTSRVSGNRRRLFGARSSGPT